MSQWLICTNLLQTFCFFIGNEHLYVYLYSSDYMLVDFVYKLDKKQKWINVVEFRGTRTTIAVAQKLIADAFPRETMTSRMS